MSGRTIGILVGIVVLGVLSFLVYKQNQKVDEIGKPTAASAELPNIAAPEDIDKISITNGDKGEVVLEKKGDQWMVTKPLAKAAPANQQSAKDAVTNIKDWKIKDRVELKLDDEVRKDKQLDAAHAVHIMAWKGADKKTDVMFGKASGAGQLVMLADKPDQVYSASGYSSYLFTKEAKDWRDKELFKFDDANASSITIENKNGKLSFTKGDKGWAGTFKGEAIAKFDENKVKDFLRDWKNLNAEDFADDKTPADAGLEKPEATVSISLKDNAGNYVLKVGAVAKESSRYAMKDGSDQIYVLGKTGSDWAMAGKDKFQQAADAGAPASSAGKPTPMPMPMQMPPH